MDGKPSPEIKTRKLSAAAWNAIVLRFAQVSRPETGNDQSPAALKTIMPQSGLGKAGRREIHGIVNFLPFKVDFIFFR